ncbi:MAG: hypothetical protein ACXAC7_09245 [Candidatus Hodarchaeales archaeon]|jgi:hypothetical protein
MSIKLPICLFDAKTGMLCGTCKERLKNGEISNHDVTVSKVLAKFQKSLHKTKFMIAIDTEKLCILIGNSNLKIFLNKNNKLLSEVEKALQKPFEVVVQEGTLKDTFVTLFAPLEVTGIDEIFVPDGTSELKIRIKGDEETLPMSRDELELIAAKISNSLVRLEFVPTT